MLIKKRNYIKNIQSTKVYFQNKQRYNYTANKNINVKRINL